jgi:predicted anti-sigma-YlaC factor YlaD
MTDPPSIDCRAFEARLDEHLRDALSEDERRALEEHARSCPTCRELLVPFARGPRMPVSAGTPDEGEAFVAAVMSRTASTVCRDCEERLDAFLAGDLSPAEVVPVREHLARCVRCREFADLVVTVTRLLPACASAGEDETFVAGVLRATIGTRRPTQARSAPWWSLRALFDRPRFALEGAYLGTVCLVLGVATPISPWQRAPGEVLTFLRDEPAAITRELASLPSRPAPWPVTFWRAAMTADSTGVSRAARCVSAGRGVVGGTWNCLRAMQGALVGGEVGEVDAALQTLGQEVERLEASLGIKSRAARRDSSRGARSDSTSSTGRDDPSDASHESKVNKGGVR